MHDLELDIRRGFSFLKYYLMLSLGMSVLEMTISKVNAQFGYFLNRASVFLLIGLLLFSSNKLKLLNEEMKKYHKWVIISIVPVLLVVFLNVDIETIMSVHIFNSAGTDWGMLTMLLIVLALEIGIGLWRSHIFRNGIVHWVEESGDSRYDYLKTLADKFFVRRVIVSAIFPLVILMGLLFTSVDPFTFLILLAIISIALLVYSLYDFIKTYIFYGECEKAASHLIVIVQGES